MELSTTGESSPFLALEQLGEPGLGHKILQTNSLYLTSTLGSLKRMWDYSYRIYLCVYYEMILSQTWEFWDQYVKQDIFHEMGQQEKSWKGAYHKGAQGKFWSWWIYSLYWFHGWDDMWNLIQLYTLHISNLLYINYTPKSKK